MPIFETYSKRKAGLPDVFTYDDIPSKFRNQVYHIWNRFFNQKNILGENSKFIRREIYNIILEEEGKKYLHYSDYNDPVLEVEQYFDALHDTDKVLDVIETTFFVFPGCIIF